MPRATLVLVVASASLLIAACSAPMQEQSSRRPPAMSHREEKPNRTTVPATVPSTTPSPPAPTTPPVVPTTAPGPVTPVGWWKPSRGVTWQWQLDGAIDTSVDVEVYDVDLFDTPASTVASLHAQGRKVVCYFTVGSWETYRPDVASMPASVKGGTVDGWPQERWLDIRRIDLIGPYMEARLDLCKSKGFDGVEGDWMDNHLQDTGFPISYADSIAYNRWLIARAHERGLAMGVKNAIDMAAELSSEADFEVNEQCAEFDECATLTPWISAGKPVLHTEYNVTPAEFCPVTAPLGFSSLYKRLELDAWRQTC